MYLKKHHTQGHAVKLNIITDRRSVAAVMIFSTAARPRMWCCFYATGLQTLLRPSSQLCSCFVIYLVANTNSSATGPDWLPIKAKCRVSPSSSGLPLLKMKPALLLVATVHKTLRLLVMSSSYRTPTRTQLSFAAVQPCWVSTYFGVNKRPENLWEGESKILVLL